MEGGRASWRQGIQGREKEKVATVVCVLWE
jgi:hypothetical protein